ncbi:hypothetical protein GCM10028798_02980 [Humibacter antri]
MSDDLENESGHGGHDEGTHRRYLATLYLDIDGVLSPLPDHKVTGRSQFRPSPWPDRRGLTFGLRPTEYEPEIAVPWSPSLVVALDQLRAEFNLRLVWNTSWLSQFPFDGIRILTHEMNGLRGGIEPEWHPIDDANDAEHAAAESIGAPLNDHPKLRLVRADQETIGGMPYIWVDDDGRRDYTDARTAPGGMFAQIKQVTSGIPSLLTAPNRYRGITPGHVARMRNWLGALANS